MADSTPDSPPGDSPPDDTELDDTELDDGDIVDVLPADLDTEGFVGEYTLPNNNRRRIPATMYLVIAAGCIAAWLAENGSSPMVNDGLLVAGILLGAFALYGFVAGWTLHIDETEALMVASAQVDFAVGHASAQMVWRGWLSRPVWRVVPFSSENPPLRRALVLVSGIDGRVIEWFEEDNPQDDEPREDHSSDATPATSAVSSTEG